MPRPLLGFSFRSPRQPLPGSAELASMAGWQSQGAVWDLLPSPGWGAIIPSCHRHGRFQTRFQSAGTPSFPQCPNSAPAPEAALRRGGGFDSHHSVPALLSREAARRPVLVTPVVPRGRQLRLALLSCHSAWEAPSAKVKSSRPHCRCWGSALASDHSPSPRGRLN